MFLPNAWDSKLQITSPTTWGNHINQGWSDKLSELRIPLFVWNSKWPNGKHHRCWYCLLLEVLGSSWTSLLPTTKWNQQIWNLKPCPQCPMTITPSFQARVLLLSSVMRLCNLVLTCFFKYALPIRHVSCYLFNNLYQYNPIYIYIYIWYNIYIII